MVSQHQGRHLAGRASARRQLIRLSASKMSPSPTRRRMTSASRGSSAMGRDSTTPATSRERHQRAEVEGKLLHSEHRAEVGAEQHQRQVTAAGRSARARRSRGRGSPVAEALCSAVAATTCSGRPHRVAGRPEIAPRNLRPKASRIASCTMGALTASGRRRRSDSGEWCGQPWASPPPPTRTPPCATKPLSTTNRPGMHSRRRVPGLTLPRCSPVAPSKNSRLSPVT